MDNLKEDIVKAIEIASSKQKEVCHTKGIQFSGIYFKTILENLAELDDKYNFSRKTLWDKIKRFLSHKKIKKAIEILNKNGIIGILLNGGGLRFMSKNDYEEYRNNLTSRKKPHNKAN